MPIYLKYGEKIKGDVKESAHPGWIELSSAQLGVSRPITSPTGGSGSRDGTHLNDIVVTKPQDSASVHLYQAAMTGEGVKAWIDFVKDGTVYLRLTMENTMIAGYSISSGDKPTESMSLNFTKVEFESNPGTPPP